MQIESKQETVTPEIAKRYLQRRKEEDQRKLKSAIVTKYAQAMLKEKFDSLNGESIKFDRKGSLIDGQHRLEAIVQSGVTLQMLVLRGIHSDAKFTLDSGNVRSKADILKYAGFDLCTNASAGIISAMIGQGIIGSVPRESIVELAFKYQDALIFVLDCFTKNVSSVTTAPVKAVVGRAYYCTEDKDRLRAFATVLMTGMVKCPEEDVSAILLRNWLINNRSARNGKEVLEVYQKTQRALRAFLDKEDLQRLYALDKEQFPIP